MEEGPLEVTIPRGRGDVAALAGLGAAVLTVHHRLLLGDTLFFRDVYLHYLPQRLFLEAVLAARELPLWDPLTNAGEPFLGRPLGFFYPSTLLSLVLPAVTAFCATVVLHHLVAAACAYALGRSTGLSVPAAALCGAAFALSGWALSTDNLLPHLFGLTWVPAAVALVHRSLTRGDRRSFVGAAFACGLPLLGGAAEVTALLFVTLLVWAAASPTGQARPARRVATVIGLALVAAALAAVQLLPTAELVRGSSRSERRSWGSFTEWSVSPRRLPELAVPGFLGPTDSLDDADFRGRLLEDQGFPYILGIYLGAPVLALALLGGLTREAAGLPLRLRRALLTLACAGVLLSLGRNLPGFRLVYEVPGIATFRFPVKAMVLALLPVALLAGCGLDAALGGAGPARGARSHARRLLAGGASVCALGALLALVPGEGNPFPAWFGVPLSPASRRGLAASFAQPALFLALSGLLLARGTRQRTGSLVAACATLDLVLAGGRVNAFAPREVLAEPPLAAAVRRVAGDGRLFRDADPGPVHLRAPSNDVAWLVRANIEKLKFYSASLYGIPSVYHVDYDGFASLGIGRLGARVVAGGWRERLPLLSAAAARAVVTEQAPPIEGLVPVAAFRGALSPGPVYLYENPGAAWVRFATEAERSPDATRAVERLLARPAGRASVVLEREPGPAEGLVNGSAAAGAPARVRVLSRRPDRAVVEVATHGSGWLVFADAYDPGWRVTVDGVERPALRADVAFIAVAVPAGRHAVEKAYVPRSVTAGACVTLATAGALLALALRWRR